MRSLDASVWENNGKSQDTGWQFCVQNAAAKESGKAAGMCVIKRRKS